MRDKNSRKLRTRICKIIYKSIRKLVLWAFLLSPISCYPSREIRILSDFCQLHEPLRDDIDPRIIEYWEKEQKIIEEKNKEGGLKTPEEQFVELMVNYAGANDKKYYDKNCS